MCYVIKVEDGPREYYGRDELIAALKRILALASKKISFRVVDDLLEYEIQQEETAVTGAHHE